MKKIGSAVAANVALFSGLNILLKIFDEGLFSAVLNLSWIWLGLGIFLAFFWYYTAPDQKDLTAQQTSSIIYILGGLLSLLSLFIQVTSESGWFDLRTFVIGAILIFQGWQAVNIYFSED
ncbi:hypothetical protein [Enterococcus timonensis]|uniref:hypothetical protein n=1 Tax=Enterococcus timonensis TaxID=1852364 RepID=UPI0008DAE5BC|nr:hypothetical protein [Enterococcus timonensis]